MQFYSTNNCTIVGPNTGTQIAEKSAISRENFGVRRKNEPESRSETLFYRKKVHSKKFFGEKSLKSLSQL